MKHLPLFYFHSHVGNAQVDDVVYADVSHLRWGIQIPSALRREFVRPDILMVALREDPKLLTRCTPWIQTHNLVIRLVQVVQSPRALKLLCELRDNPFVRKGHICKKIKLESLLFSHVTYADGSRTNLQRTNLRVIKPEIDMSFLSVSHTESTV